MRLWFWGVLCVVLASAARLVVAGRATRGLVFRKGSSFFYRMNYKITSFPEITTIFAQAAGFKVAWELPATANDAGFRAGRSIPDVHESAELVYESHGFDGKSCLLKNICQAIEYVRRKDGVIAKILKLLVGSYINNGTLSGKPLFCEEHVKGCPLELIGFNTFVES